MTWLKADPPISWEQSAKSKGQDSVCVLGSLLLALCSQEIGGSASLPLGIDANLHALQDLNIFFGEL
jgi:hypothetical protein